jgi:hypothetical protein
LGVTHSEAAQSGCILDSFTYVRDHFDAMWYFQHHVTANTGCGNPGDVYDLVQYTEQNNTFQVTSRGNDWTELNYLLQYLNP